MTTRPTRLREWIAVLAAGAFVSLLYVDKPFHIDDVLYLRVVDQILRTPLDPYQGIVLWDAKDGQPASLFLTNHNPPLSQYIQAAALYAFVPPERRGESEYLLHWLQSAAVVVAGLGVFQLARRLCPYPLWATLFVLSAPFFLPGQNIMLEAPALAFAAWGVEFYWRARLGISPLQWASLSGVLIAAAILTKYSAGVLLPILGWDALRRREFRSLALMIAPIAALAAWAVWTSSTHGRPHLGAHGVAFEIARWHFKALTAVREIGAVQTVGGALVLAAMFQAGRMRQWTWLVGLACAAAGLSVIDIVQARRNAALENADVTPLQQAQFALFTAHGFLSIAVAALATRLSSTNSGDDRFLWWWIAGVFLFNVCCTPFAAVRHLLLLFVPFVFLSGRILERLGAGGFRWGALLASVILGTGLASADYQFAESAAETARKDVRGLVVDRAANSRTVWFSGNWGFVYYAQRAGAFPWVKNPETYGMPSIQPGDYVVQPKIMSWVGLDRALPRGMKLERFQHWQPMARVEGTPASILGQLLRTIAPGVNYYAVKADALPWEVLVLPVDPQERQTGATFAIPTMGDYIVYRVTRIGPAGD